MAVGLFRKSWCYLRRIAYFKRFFQLQLSVKSTKSPTFVLHGTQTICPMEIILYSTITLFWWISSFTLFLPLTLLLKTSKKFQNLFFSFIYSKVVIPFFIVHQIPKRKWAFDLLKKHRSKLHDSSPVELLEIGVGTGTNMEFYPEGTQLTALEMNDNFLESFQETVKKHKHVTLKRTVIGSAEDMMGIEDSSMDAVVGTYVLCSVTNVENVLKEVYRVLKPGGVYVFVEHVAFQKSPWKLAIQQFAEPLWKFYFGGCHITRKTIDNIRKSGFSEIIADYTDISRATLFTQPHDLGLAIK